MSEEVEQSHIDTLKDRLNRLRRSRDHTMLFGLGLLAVSAITSSLGISFGMEGDVAGTATEAGVAVMSGGMAVGVMFVSNSYDHESSALTTVIEQHNLTVDQSSTS